MKPRKLLPAVALCAIVLAGCGNKGPLVRPSDVPPVEPAAEPAADDATLPDLTPPEQPPVTDAVAPPPAAQDDGD